MWFRPGSSKSRSCIPAQYNRICILFWEGHSGFIHRLLSLLKPTLMRDGIGLQGTAGLWLCTRMIQNTHSFLKRKEDCKFTDIGVFYLSSCLNSSKRNTVINTNPNYSTTKWLKLPCSLCCLFLVRNQQKLHITTLRSTSFPNKMENLTKWKKKKKKTKCRCFFFFFFLKLAVLQSCSCSAISAVIWNNLS